MLRDGGGVTTRSFDELAVTQFFERGLNGAFGEAGCFREHTQTRGDRFPFSANSLSVEIKVNEKRGRLAIVADDVPHQNIEHVIIDRNCFAKTRHGRSDEGQVTSDEIQLYR
jgi:hypothetical protein